MEILFAADPNSRRKQHLNKDNARISRRHKQWGTPLLIRKRIQQDTYTLHHGKLYKILNNNDNGYLTAIRKYHLIIICIY
jgi:hypothetical protein